MRGNYNDSPKHIKTAADEVCKNCGGSRFVTPSGTLEEYLAGTTPQIPCPACNG